MTSAAIPPGAHVRAGGVLIGIVERVEAPDTEYEADGVLLVRADDGARFYRLPRALVTAVGEESGRSGVSTVVQLAVDRAALDQYAIGAETDAETRAAGETLRVPLAAEELTAETQPVRLGTVHVHKGVETTEQRLTAPVTREEVIVEHIPADQYEASAPPDPDETVIPVLEERLVVETRTVVTEYVRVRKRRITEDQEVYAPLRREIVTVEERRAEGTTAPVRSLLSGEPDVARQDDTVT